MSVLRHKWIDGQVVIEEGLAELDAAERVSDLFDRPLARPSSEFPGTVLKKREHHSGLVEEVLGGEGPEARCQRRDGIAVRPVVDLVPDREHHLVQAFQEALWICVAFQYVPALLVQVELDQDEGPVGLCCLP